MTAPLSPPPIRSRRRRFLRWAALALAVLLAVAFLGPRARLDSRLPEGRAAVPTDLLALPAWLAASETKAGPLRPETEKTILWADPTSPAKTEFAVVYLHGFSATRQETAPFPELLSGKLQANLFYTRLTGHGQSGVELGRATANDWLGDVAEAMAVARVLGHRTIVVGTSSGATLALWWAATQPADEIQALVLISPNFLPRDERARFALWPWGRQVARPLTGGMIDWEATTEEAGRFWTTQWDSDAVVEMLTLPRAVEGLDLGRIRTPTLILHSPEDWVVSLAALRRRLPDFRAQPFRVVEILGSDDPAGHVLAGRILSPSTTGVVVQESVDFLASIGASGGPAPR
ncbi:MAG: alpha/beta fold hydrolase [Opitutaceae bacterium]|nr:alpha/beta fold hydrolase [Opitutaceae bacterium]